MRATLLAAAALATYAATAAALLAWEAPWAHWLQRAVVATLLLAAAATATARLRALWTPVLVVFALVAIPVLTLEANGTVPAAPAWTFTVLALVACAIVVAWSWADPATALRRRALGLLCAVLVVASAVALRV